MKQEKNIIKIFLTTLFFSFSFLLSAQDTDGDGVLDTYEYASQLVDTDNDGIPDFEDVDDDNDGVNTIDENPNPDNDGNPYTGATQDLDNDGIFDYLDDDEWTNNPYYLTGSPQWKVNSGCMFNGRCEEENNTVYYLNGDTTVGAYTYRKLFEKGEHNETWMAPPPSINCGNNYTFNNFRALLREDSNKIFILESNTEELLFDFNLSIGDTLPTTYMVVTGIESVLIDDKYRTKFILDNDPSQFLIEGIGHHKGFLEPIYLTMECGFRLECFSLRDTLTYPFNSGSCDFALSIREVEFDQSATIFPNPAKNKVIIRFSKAQKINTIKVFDIIGKSYEIEYENDAFGNITLNLNKLSKGVYTILVVNNNYEQQSFRLLKD
jgi:hypothetical protein